MRDLAKCKAKFLRGIVLALILNLTPIFWISSINPSFADGVQAPINLSVTLSDWGTIPLAGGANQKSSFYVVVPLVPGIEDYRLFAYSSGDTVEVLTSSLTLVQPAFPVDWYDANGNYAPNVMVKKFIFDSLPAGVEYNFGIQSIDPAAISDSTIAVRTAAGNPLVGIMTRIRPKVESLDQSYANPGDLITVNGSNLDWINRNQNGNEDGIELATCIEYCEPDPSDDPVYAYVDIPLADFISQSSTSITFEFPSVLPNGVSPGAVWEVIPNAYGAVGSAFLTVGSANGQISRSISVSSGANGTITPGTSAAISDGSAAVYTITPDTGYEIASVAVDGISVLELLSDVDGVSKSYTFDSVTSNHTIAATFRLPPESAPTYLLKDASGEYEFIGDGTSQHSFFRMRWTKAPGVLDYKIRVTPTGQAAQIYLFSDLQRITNPVYVPSNSCSGNFCYATISALNTGPDYQIEIASVGGVGKSDSAYVSRLYNNDTMPSIFHTNFKPVNRSVSQVLTEPGDLITIHGAHLDLAQRIIFDAYIDETLDTSACWVDENDEEFCGEFSIEASDFVVQTSTSISFYVPETFPSQLPASTSWEGYATRIDGYGFFGRVQFELSTTALDVNPPVDHGLVPDIVNLSREEAVLALGSNFTLGSTSGTTSVNATPQNDGKIATQSVVGDQSYGSVISYTTYAYSRPIVNSAPGAPTSVVAIKVGKHGAKVTFNAPVSNGGSSITNYVAVSNPGNISQILLQSTGGTFTFDGLQPGTSYTFSVIAINSVGSSSPSISNSTKTDSLVEASLSSLKFEDDGTGTGGKLIWTGMNIDAVLYTGPPTAYPAPYNYGAFTSGWNGQIRNLISDTSYTMSIFAISADGIGESKTLTFKTGLSASSTQVRNVSISISPNLSPLGKLFEWIDRNIFIADEASLLKKLFNKFDAAPIVSNRAYLKLPTSRLVQVSAISETPEICKLENGLTVHALVKGNCTITYSVVGRSKVPVSLTKEFNFPKV